MRALRHLRHKLLDDDVEHRARGEGQHHGHHRGENRRQPDGQQRAQRLNRAGQHPQRERLLAAHARLTQGHGDNRAFGHVLQGDADGKGERAGEGYAAELLRLHTARVDHANRHPLRQIMQRNGERDHHRPGERRAQTLLFAVQVDVRDEAIQQKQEENPKPKPNRRGQE